MIDRNVHAQEFFKAQAAACRRRTQDDQLKFLAYQSFAKNLLSYKFSYDAPPTSIEAAFPGSFPDLRAKIPGSESVVTNNRHPGGWEIYHRGTESKHYYGRDADDQIIEKNIHKIGKAIHNKKVLELAVGDGTRTANVLRLAHEAGYEPAHYIINDIVDALLKPAGSGRKPNSQSSSAVDAIINGGLPQKKLGTLPGDITSDSFWDQDFSQIDVVIMLGATVGLLTPDQLLSLVKKIRTKCNKGIKILFSADSSEDETTVQTAHEDDNFKLWLNTGFVRAFSLIIPKSNLDTSSMRCEMKTKRWQKEGLTSIQPTITFSNPQEFVVKNTKGERIVLTTEEPFYYEWNRKYGVGSLFNHYFSGFEHEGYLSLDRGSNSNIHHGIWMMNNSKLPQLVS